MNIKKYYSACFLIISVLCQSSSIEISTLLLNTALTPYQSVQTAENIQPSPLAPLYSLVTCVKHILFGEQIHLTTSPAHTPIAIVMDLGEVVFTTNTKEFTRTVGIMKFIKAGIFNKKKFRNVLFSILHEAKPFKTSYEQDTHPTDEAGEPLPLLMIEWMTGAISGEMISKIVHEYLEKNPTRLTGYKRELIENVIYHMTSTETFIKTRLLYQEAVVFAQECKNAGYSLYVLSNWPPTQTELIRTFPEFFNLVDGIMLSGNVHMLKPDRAIFIHFLDTFKLQARNTIFIDDLLINIKAAQQVGMHAIICPQKGTSPDFEKVRQQMNTIINSMYQKQKYALI